MLILRERLTFSSEVVYVTFGEIILVICMFFAYLILMKVFMKYQKQMNEANAKQAEQQLKANEKAVKKAAAKFEEAKLSGETSVIPLMSENDENLLSEPHKTDSRISKIDIKTSLNSSPKRESVITDPGDMDAFVTRALSSKQTGRQERINSVATVCEDADEKSSEGSDEDSFCTDSSGDSAFDPSSDDDSYLDEEDKALQ